MSAGWLEDDEDFPALKALAVPDELPTLNGHDSADDEAADHALASLNGQALPELPDDAPLFHVEPPRSRSQPQDMGYSVRSLHEPAGPAEWPEPANLWGEGANLAPWRPEYSPPAISAYVQDQADMRGLNATMQAACCNTVLSFLLQRGIYLDLAPGSGPDSMGWRCLPLLWTLIRGEPGDGKGPAMDAALYRPMKIGDRWTAQDLDAWKEYDTQAKIHEKRMQQYIAEAAKNPHIQRPEPPEKPPRRRLFADDMTKEAIARLLVENPRGTIALIKGELSSLWGSMGAYGGSGSEKDRGDWLEAYEGKRRFIDRVKDGGSWDVPEWRVGILGGIQPTKLAEMAGKMGDDGMMQRFQVICSTPKEMKRPRHDDAEATAQWTRVCENLAKMEPRGNAVHLSRAAGEFFWQCQEWINSAREGAPVDPLKFALNKWESLLGRLMLVSHCIAEANAGRDFPAPEIPLAVAEQCFRWMQKILWPHALHFYTATVGASGTARDVAKFADFALARNLETIKPGYLPAKWTYYAQNIKTGQQRREFWDSLVALGWLRPTTTATDRSGQLAAEYAVNPAVHILFADRARLAANQAARHRETMPAEFDRRQPGQH